MCSSNILLLHANLVMVMYEIGEDDEDDEDCEDDQIDED